METSDNWTTPWGTQKAVLRADGRPKLAKPEADGAKLDDERVYVKIDKDRIGGEGPTIALEFDKPSGRIYEQEVGHA